MTFSIDAVGNVVGALQGQRPKGDCQNPLLTGSHYDTVRNGGKYDGRLGIFVPMACVRELHRQGKRLPFGIEVVAFAEEEGQRYPATFLGSGALTGHFNPDWLDQLDADGISMRQAMLGAGLPDPDAIAHARNPADYLGFVEVHIEQGPVLNARNLPLGIVTSINGSARFLGEVTGVASHAGTTPMDRRRDAACAVAELALYVEARAATMAIRWPPWASCTCPQAPSTWCRALPISAWTCAPPTMPSAMRLVADVLQAAQPFATRRWPSLQADRNPARQRRAQRRREWQARWEAACASPGPAPVQPAQRRGPRRHEAARPPCPRPCCLCAAKTAASATTRWKAPQPTTCSWPWMPSATCPAGWRRKIQAFGHAKRIVCYQNICPISTPNTHPQAVMPCHTPCPPYANNSTPGLTPTLTNRWPFCRPHACTHRHPTRPQRPPRRAHRQLLQDMGYQPLKRFDVPAAEVQRRRSAKHYQPAGARRFGQPTPYPHPTVLLNAHGDVVPPGEGWTHDPYGGEVVDGTGRIYGRAAAVSKSDFATYTFALRALEAPSTSPRRKKAAWSCCSPTTKNLAANVGPGWLLQKKIIHPDLVLAAGFSYQVVTAHSGCLQLEVTVHGDMAHAAIPDSGTDALQGATHILNALYAAQCGVQGRVQVRRGRHHPPLPERRPHQRRHQHQRDSRQSGAQAGPAHDPRGRPRAGGGGLRATIAAAAAASTRPVGAKRSCGGRTNACCWPAP
jgi:acetylornithine deacetylase/succinyl-diaminopimelate desuccinylase-like protein